MEKLEIAKTWWKTNFEADPIGRKALIWDRIIQSLFVKQ
jgi:hypothetical protein